MVELKLTRGDLRLICSALAQMANNNIDPPNTEKFNKIFSKLIYDPSRAIDGINITVNN